MARQFGQIVHERRLYQLTREMVIRARAQLVAKGLSTHEDIAKEFGLSVGQADLCQDGMLAEDTIILKQFGTTEERRNFTFYHELTHHLIRTNDDLLSLIHETAAHPDRVIERLCNAGAAEFLAPAEEVIAFAEKHGFATTTIPILCEKYEASGLVVAFQMTANARHACHLIIAEPKPVPFCEEQLSLAGISPNRNSWCLTITYTARSAQAKYSITKNSLIPRDHLITAAYEEKNRVTGSAVIPSYTGTKTPIACDCLFFHGNVYAFFNASPPPGPGQLRLL